ncbi:MAG: type IV toxin-antitoxin system AbiEi family antitoxin domain-containing protein [Actinomycetota bacterium]|nr:type IV toxin-antitoxin system AbiEi family antitoxin domain-containing protein [Actinomycetota bacterium]
MGYGSTQNLGRAVWALARRQHFALARRQLLGLGMHPQAIKHRVAVGRLHPVHAGVYAVGRPELSRLGELLAAVLACGDGAVLSHGAAAELWGVCPRGRAEVTVPPGRTPRRPGIVVHRAALASGHRTLRHAVPITTPARTLVDVAPYLPPLHLERAVNEADRLDLIDPERLRSNLDELAGTRGVANLRRLLDRRTFSITDSVLERRFKPIARAAGLPEPLTQQWVNGLRVDFFWPELGLVVETDGLRYHRTPAQQARAHVRDQTHLAADLLALRFTHAQVTYERPYVEATLRRVAARLRRSPVSPAPAPPGSALAP